MQPDVFFLLFLGVVLFGALFLLAATFFTVEKEGFEVSRLGYSNRVVISYRVAEGTGLGRRERQAVAEAKIREIQDALASKGIVADSRGHYVCAAA